MITTDDLRAWVSLLERGESEELERAMTQRLLDEERTDVRESERRERETTPTRPEHSVTCGEIPGVYCLACHNSAASH